jgi:hypothetical protein
MTDLDLLRELPGHHEPLDVAARERVRSLMVVKTSSPRRGLKRPAIGALAVAATMVFGGAAAALTDHLWTSQHPVAIAVKPSPTQAARENPTIPNPLRSVTTDADFEATVSEFSPAIRLPEEGSFDAWVQHMESGPASGLNEGGLSRLNVVEAMVFVSECQWGHDWLDASAAGDDSRTALSMRVLGQISDWEGQQSDVGATLLRHMEARDTSFVQRFETVNCTSDIP